MRQSFNQDFSKVQFLFPYTNNIENLVSRKAFVPFEDTVCAFLAEAAQRVMKDAEARRYPDVVTFGFFCRRANIEQIKKSYGERLSGRLGRGLTFHIAPSNVPVNFAYTLAAGLLSGNRCIVRASSKDFPQIRILCRIFNEAAECEEYKGMRDAFAVVMYEHDAGITAELSSAADVRVIWGGDGTVAEIRKAPLAPRAFDITFADRYSFAVFDAGFVLAQSEPEMKRRAQDFYNDTYLYDQNACSSPRLIVWLGTEEDCGRAKEKFWKAVHEHISARYELAPILAVDKLSAQYKCAVELSGAKAEPAADNLITRVNVRELPGDITDYACAGGFYLEYDTERLSDIIPVITGKCQTLSYLGVGADDLRTLVVESGLSGIDRIVPVGKTADFVLVWDGYDLILTMSRVISVR